MDYKSTLRYQLLSQSNIDFLVGTILETFKISQKAISKCTNIITNNLNKYLDNIDRYPQNNSELIEAINFLNKKCFDDFTLYLSTKYPNMNLVRSTHDNNQFHEDDFIISPQNNNDKYAQMIILDEEEKNKLLEQIKPSEKIFSEDKNKASTDFLTYLTDPLVLQMFGMMINQINQQNVPVKQPNQIIIDEILDSNQVQKLLNLTQNSQETKQPVPAPNGVPKINTKKEIVQYEMDDIDEITNQPEEITENETNNEQDVTIDLTKKLTKETLPLIKERINELISLKNKYLADKNMKMVKQIDEEKEQIINAVREYKKELEKEAKENENKISGISMQRSTRPNEGDNVEYLDLTFDPTNDYNDLKNIVIKIKAENKITDITLVDYNLPFNSNNVTRFNNKFTVYFNNRVNKIVIPPAKYDIQTLFDYIKNQATFLDFSINDNKIITIKNTMGMKFDLMIDSDTIFPLLGFTGKIDTYKDKIFYSASQEYDMNCNEKVRFSLSGSTMEPMDMEFNNNVTLNKSLKKSRAGVTIKQIILQFNNTLGQCYDFILPFKMCFRITYVPKTG